MTRLFRTTVLASCALAAGLSTAALAQDGDSSNRSALQSSIYQTLRGDYMAPAPVEGGYLVEGRASVAGPPPGEPRPNEWRRYEETNTPFEMRPADRPQD